MIEGLIGILIALILFVWVLFFYKRKPNPAIAKPLNKFMTNEGFRSVGTSDPLLKPVKDVFRVTKYHAYIEQAFLRDYDNSLICWISTSTEGANNAIVSIIPQTIKTDKWIILYLPSLQGGLGSVVRKGYEKMVLSSDFSKISSKVFGYKDGEFDLYMKDSAVTPPFNHKFISALKQCGDMVIRSNGMIAVLERIYPYSNRIWEQEAKEILRVTDLIRGNI